MSTPEQTAAACVTHLKAAKAKAGGIWGWPEVEAALVAFHSTKPATVAPAAKATVDGIYAIYPRKKQPRTAKVAIQRAAKRLAGEPDPLAYLLERTRLFSVAVALWPEADRQYVPYPATWFNGDCFDENPKDWEERGAKVTGPKDYTKL